MYELNQSCLHSDRPIKGETDSVCVPRNPPGKDFCVKGSLLLLYCEMFSNTLPPE